MEPNTRLPATTENHLHGGNCGFNSMLWEWELEERNPGPAVCIISAGMVKRIPGNLDVWTEIHIPMRMNWSLSTLQLG